MKRNKRIDKVGLILLGILLLCGMVIGWEIKGAVEDIPVNNSVALSYETTRVSFQNISQALNDNFSRATIICNHDKNYNLPNLSFFKIFLAEDDLDKSSFIEERFDCDDFAWALKGRSAEKGIPLAFAATSNPEIIDIDEPIIEPHAFNLFITIKEGELEFYVVEPQSDTINLIEDDFKEKISLILI